MTPIQTIEKLIIKYDIQLKSGVFTFLFGLMTHLYVLTNKFFNYFEMGNIFSTMSYDQGDSLGLGRWFLPVATNLLTQFSSPLLNGLFVMLYMSLAAGLICELFGIKRLLNRCLFGAVWVSFPGMASLFSYGVNSDALALSVLLAVLAVYLEEKYRWGVLLGGVVLCLSVGTYQPYLAVAIGVAFSILLLYLIQEIYDRKIFWRKFFRLLITLMIGFALYYIVLQLILRITSMTLSDYHGVDDMTSFTMKGITKGGVYTYLYFLKYFFSREYLLTWGSVICNVLCAIIFIVAIWKSYTRIKYTHTKEQTILVCCVLLLLPLGVNAAPFLMADRVGNGVDIYMIVSLMLLWALFIKIVLEQNTVKLFSGQLGGKVIQWAGMLCLCVTVVSGLVICNQAYHRMDAMTQTTSALLERLVARMEVLPEWDKDIPVYFKNPRNLVNEQYEVSVPQYEMMSKLPGTAIWPNYNEDAIERFCEVYLHFPVNLATEEQKEKLDQNETVENMPAFPAKDSIQVIDGVMVVKVSAQEK